MVSSGIRKSLQIRGLGKLVSAFAVMGLFTEEDFSFCLFWNENFVILFIARVRVRARKNQLALAWPSPWTVYSCQTQTHTWATHVGV